MVYQEFTEKLGMRAVGAAGCLAGSLFSAPVSSQLWVRDALSSVAVAGMVCSDRSHHTPWQERDTWAGP